MNHNVGDSVVNSDNLKTGNVLAINEDTNEVQVSYTDGQTEWVDSGNIKKLLLETDPPFGNTLSG
jgi:hypothetical protein